MTAVYRKPKLVPLWHTYDQLLHLPTTLANPETTSLSALIHLDTPADVEDLPGLLKTLASQSFYPNDIIVIAPSSLHPELRALLDAGKSPVRPRLAPPTHTEPALAYLDVGKRAQTDFILCLSVADSLPHDDSLYSLIHMAGTTEYGAAVLAHSGYELPNDQAVCDAAKSSASHLPLGPILLQTTWLASPSLESGLRLDLPPSAAIALALWSKFGIGAFLAPVPDGASARAGPCPPVILPKSTLSALANLYTPQDPASGKDYSGSSSSELLSGLSSHRVGFIFDQIEDIALLAPLACAVAARAPGGVELLTFGLDLESVRNRTQKAIPCHLRIRPLRVKFPELRKDVVFYVRDRWTLEAALRSLGADLGRREDVGEAEMTAIGLPRDEVASADWIGTLPTEALKRACELCPFICCDG